LSGARSGSARRGPFACTVGLALLLAGPASSASTPCRIPGFEPANAAVSLRDAIQSGFFDRGGCDSALAGRIERWRTATLGDSADPWQWREPEVQDSLAALIAAVRDGALARLEPGVHGRAQFEKKLGEWRVRLASRDLSRSPDEEWRPMRLSLFAGGDDEVKLDSLLDARCASPGADCDQAQSDVAVLVTAAVQVRTVLDVPWTNARRATVYHIASLDRRWTSYLAGARAMYPWEMALNGWLTARRYHRRGFVEPPGGQLLFLHPDAGFQHARHGSERLENTVVLEGLGYYAWRWNADDEMSPAFGASYALAWDGDTGRPLSHGVLVHLPRNWSAGVVWKRVEGSTQTRYLMTGDVGKLFTRRSELARQLVDRVLRSAR
jgi:hypothetical protein